MQEKLEKTRYPGIYYKRDRELYIVTLDFGRTETFDEKTGQVRMKQNKVRKTAATLKDAVAIKSEHELMKRLGKVQGALSVVSFYSLALDYVAARRFKWSDSYTQRQFIHIDRIQSYLILTGRDKKPARTFCAANIEEFFVWCTKTYE